MVQVEGEETGDLMLGGIIEGKFFDLPVDVLDLGDAGDAALLLHLLRTLLLTVDRLLSLNLYPLLVLNSLRDVLVDDGIIHLSLVLYCLVVIDYLFDPGFLMEDLAQTMFIQCILVGL